MKLNKKNICRARKIIESISHTESFKISFVHTSYQNEHNLSYSYQNMEWLGDSILGFLISDIILQAHPSLNEGQLSKLRQLMVQKSTLAELSKTLNLSNYLKLGEGERKNGGGEKQGVLSDIFESFLAALYREKGLSECVEFLSLTILVWVKGKEHEIWDYKSELQQVCQSKKEDVSYSMVSAADPDSGNLFTMEVTIRDESFREIIKKKSKGKSKKEAEQRAAYKVLDSLGFIKKKRKINNICKLKVKCKL